jgi:phosphate:Na+ symporter
VETDLVHSGRKRIEKQVRVSPDTQESVNALAEQVVLMLERATEAVDRGDRGLANEVIEAKDDINALAERVSSRLVDRLIAEDPHRTSTYRVESQLVENYKRIYYFTKRIAKMVAVVELLEERPEPEYA